MRNYISESTKHTNTVTKILIMAFFILALMYGAYKFGKYYEFQSPVSIRLPFKKNVLYENYLKIEPLTPTPTKPPTPSFPKGRKEGATLSVPIKQILPITKSMTIDPFKKYLIPEANEVRNKILAIAGQKYSGDELTALDNILKKESGYRLDAINEIGACGIGQALPCEKMGCPLNYSDGAMNCQLNWVINYITNRYKTPTEAWKFHLAKNWY